MFTTEEEFVLLIIKHDSKTKSEIRKLLNEILEEETNTLNLTLEILSHRGHVVELESFPPRYEITEKGIEALKRAANDRIKAELIGKVR